MDALKTTLISGIFAFLGVIGGGAVTGWFQIELAKQKFTSELIMKALESPSGQERLESLNFLAQTHILQDANMQKGVADYAKSKQSDPESIPQVSAPSSSDNLSKSVEFAKSKEQEGYKELIAGNFEAAQLAFEAAENSVNGYRNVYELANLLRKKSDDLKDQNKRKEVFKTIVDQYWGYTTSDQLKELRKLAQ